MSITKPEWVLALEELEDYARSRGWSVSDGHPALIRRLMAEHDGVAQSVERLAEAEQVAGSTPAPVTNRCGCGHPPHPGLICGWPLREQGHSDIRCECEG